MNHDSYPTEPIPPSEIPLDASEWGQTTHYMSANLDPRERRNIELFKPLPYFDAMPAQAGETEQNYDYLFAEEAVYRSHPPKVDRFGIKEKQWLPTEETRTAAKDRLITAAEKDEALTSIIQSQAGQLDVSDPLKVVDALRLKPDFRLSMGSYLLEKVNNYAQIEGAMPERIVRNQEKAPDRGGYHMPRMSSREYAALLALSMLDGTFDKNQILESDPVEERDGVAVQGQHRAAALKVLGLKQV